MRVCLDSVKTKAAVFNFPQRTPRIHDRSQMRLGILEGIPQPYRNVNEPITAGKLTLCSRHSKKVQKFSNAPKDILYEVEFHTLEG
jgi:hypothetical protein